MERCDLSPSAGPNVQDRIYDSAPRSHSATPTHVQPCNHRRRGEHVGARVRPQDPRRDRLRASAAAADGMHMRLAARLDARAASRRVAASVIEIRFAVIAGVLVRSCDPAAGACVPCVPAASQELEPFMHSKLRYDGRVRIGCACAHVLDCSCWAIGAAEAAHVLTFVGDAHSCTPTPTDTLRCCVSQSPFRGAANSAGRLGTPAADKISSISSRRLIAGLRGHSTERTERAQRHAKLEPKPYHLSNGGLRASSQG